MGLVTLMVRRSAVASLDHPFDPRYHVLGDTDLVIRLSNRWKLDCAHEPLAVYRLHRNNETAKHLQRLIDEYKCWLADLQQVDAFRSSAGLQSTKNLATYIEAMHRILHSDSAAALRLARGLPWGRPKLGRASPRCYLPRWHEESRIRIRFVTKSPQKYVDFNSILMGLNFLVACLVVYGSSYAENNAYIDQETIVLGLLLCLQTHVALQIERRRRDPFVTLLAFTTILYFSFRIFTLAVYPFSMVFVRYSYGPQDSNYAMIFIIVANLLLYAGFLLVKFPESRQVIASDNWRPITPSRIIGLMVTSIIYAYFTAIYWTPEDEPRIVTSARHFHIPPTSSC